MTKTNELDALAALIEDVQIERKPNKYDGHIQVLAAAGEGKQIPVTVPKGETREGGSAEGRPDRMLFQAAARDAGYSARVKSVVDNGDGTITFRFALGAPQNRKGSGSADESGSVESADGGVAAE